MLWSSNVIHHILVESIVKAIANPHCKSLWIDSCHPRSVTRTKKRLVNEKKMPRVDKWDI